MGKLVLVLVLFLSCFLITGCSLKEIHVYSDDEIEEFDKLVSNGKTKTKMYDIRSESVCIEGRIPGFICMRPTNSQGEERTLDKIFDYLILVIGDEYGYRIILMDNDGQDSRYIAEKLLDKGYYNVHFFSSGYNRYVELKGDSFIPEVGDCNIC